VIRGLDGDRIRILQNGTNTVDVSTTSPDHAVNIDPLSTERIEIVRGPATLLFGPNAIGGVVNVINTRIPDEHLSGPWPVRGMLDGRIGSVDDELSGAGMLEFGIGGLVLHIDGFKRTTDDIHIPDYARSARIRGSDRLSLVKKKSGTRFAIASLKARGLRLADRTSGIAAMRVLRIRATIQTTASSVNRR
jgi:iron complex outermembrane receptor protein